ncbi:DEAD/DEAH box helicase [Buchnera aphidicola (Taiwanaphis decaspermi)]|uniref:DEAD/DEAH box helicase n=1 Tax=Buchnera aphidicola TaxID=9 RepID=UPI0031B81692
MTNIETTFSKLGLKKTILKSLNKMSYVTPSPIQKACIPYLLDGEDVLGMAQTGSGKTAAFALPLLHNINIKLKFPQILVLTPTRELAIQVSKSFIEFSKYIKNIKILPLYGGQKYDLQLKILKQGPQIVVGTPGRLLDHLKRGTLILSKLKGLVLDEADEMLRMGFIEDVESILSKIPAKHQTALFSATMPEEIRRISRRFMIKPREIQIKSNITTRPDIEQTYWLSYGRKTEALIRFLESENFSATIIFVRTKNLTLEVSEALEKSGYNSAALNGDMNQSLREKTLEKLKNGNLDILIATDVAARGLDVERISLVINYDIPMDVESYVHRIGRTGRAGRKGKALLFVEPRERRLLRNIENKIKVNIKEIKLPDLKKISEKRIKNFSKKIEEELKSKDLIEYQKLLPKINSINELNIEKLAAALLKIAQKNRPLIISKDKFFNISNYKNNRNFKKNNLIKQNYYKRKIVKKKYKNMNLYRIDIGKKDCVEVRNIVGAISNETNINNYKIGNIKLYQNFSVIELSKTIPINTLRKLNNINILNKKITIKLITNNNRFNNTNLINSNKNINYSKKKYNNIKKRKFYNFKPKFNKIVKKQ